MSNIQKMADFLLNTFMRFFEFNTTTPQQTKINLLKQQKERASTALKAERDKQRKQKALTAIQKNNEVLSKLNKTF